MTPKRDSSKRKAHVKCPENGPHFGVQKTDPKMGAILGFHLNAYCNSKVDPILGSVFCTPKWGPRFGSILHLQGNRECSLRCAKRASESQAAAKKKKKMFQTDDFLNMLLALYLCPGPSELGRACNLTLEAVPRFGRLGGGRRSRNGSAAARAMTKEGVARGCQNGLEALRRVGSLEAFRGADGGLGTGRKDCIQLQPAP